VDVKKQLAFKGLALRAIFFLCAVGIIGLLLFVVELLVTHRPTHWCWRGGLGSLGWGHLALEWSDCRCLLMRCHQHTVLVALVTVLLLVDFLITARFAERPSVSGK
jgi:hypothetical protein